MYPMQTWANGPLGQTPITAARLNVMEAGIKTATLFESVRAHGAKGDGVADDTAAVQSAIDAGRANGRAVWVEAGTYRLTQTLQIGSGLGIYGQGPLKSILKQTSTTAHGFAGTDVDSFILRDLQFIGPGRGVGTGHCILADRSGRDNTYRWDFDNLWLRQFGLDGINVSNLIVSELSMVISEEMGRHGFNIHGVSGGSAGTSVTFNGCYGNGCLGAGFHIDTMVYLTFNACAADSCGGAYEIVGANNHTQGIVFNGCGFESPENRSEAYPGFGWKINQGFGIVLNACWSFLNRHIAYWVTGNAQNITMIGCTENSPIAGAITSYKVDAGSSANLIGISYETEPIIEDGPTSRGLIHSNTYFERSIGVGTNPTGVNGDLTVANILRMQGAELIKFGVNDDTGLYRAGVNRLGTDGGFYLGGAIEMYGGLGVGMAPGADGSLSVADVLNLPYGAQVNFGPDATIYRSGVGQLTTDGAFTISDVLNLPYGAQVNFGPDASLYRSGVNQLRTDNDFIAQTVKTGDYTTANRPPANSLQAGTMVYDATLKKPIWTDGAVWRDAMATAV